MSGGAFYSPYISIEALPPRSY